MLSFCLHGRPRMNVRQKVQRAARAARVEPVLSARKKSKQVRFRKAMKVYDKIKSLLSNILHEFENPDDRKRSKAIAQRYPIDHQGFIGITGELDQFAAVFADCNRDPGIGKLLANSAQCRQ